MFFTNFKKGCRSKSVGVSVTVSILVRAKKVPILYLTLLLKQKCFRDQALYPLSFPN